MTKRIVLLLCSVLVLLAACTGRHVVVERETGRVDGDRSISTSSDIEWQIEQEPRPAAESMR